MHSCWPTSASLSALLAAEDDDSLTADEKALLRFQKQRMKDLAGGKFALPDEDAAERGGGADGASLGGGERLTHMGRSLDELDEGYQVGASLIPHGLDPSWAYACITWGLAGSALNCCAAVGAARLRLLQGWGSDGDGGDDGLGDEGLDAQMVRDLHFGGGLFEKSKRPQHADGGEDGQQQQQQQRKSKKEVRRALWQAGGVALRVPAG